MIPLKSSIKYAWGHQTDVVSYTFQAVSELYGFLREFRTDANGV